MENEIDIEDKVETETEKKERLIEEIIDLEMELFPNRHPTFIHSYQCLKMIKIGEFECIIVNKNTGKTRGFDKLTRLTTVSSFEQNMKLLLDDLEIYMDKERFYRVGLPIWVERIKQVGEYFTDIFNEEEIKELIDNRKELEPMKWKWAIW